MFYTVFHAKEPTFGFGDTPKFPRGYTAVAWIESETLADTFRITNHISESWEENPEVVKVLSPNNRSTSVGDIMEDADGKVFICEMVGWKELEVA